jgi:hypothetical protein
METGIKRALLQALGGTAQAGLHAVTHGSAPATGTGRRRSTKGTCTPCAARAALLKAKASVRSGTL